MVTFWKWLFYGTGSAPAGFKNIFNRYIIVHIAISTAGLFLINSDPFDFASKALFPAASILVGMSLAWTTRAAALFQSSELREALFKDGRPAEDYVYGFQLAILAIIIMVVYVALMAGGGIYLVVFGNRVDKYIAGFFLYLLLSISIRECWGVINFTNMLSVLEYKRRK